MFTLFPWHHNTSHLTYFSRFVSDKQNWKWGKRSGCYINNGDGYYDKYILGTAATCILLYYSAIRKPRLEETYDCVIIKKVLCKKVYKELRRSWTARKNGFLGIPICLLGITLNSGISSNESAQFLSLFHSRFPCLSPPSRKKYRVIF
jgi:hypothetical protein